MAISRVVIMGDASKLRPTIVAHAILVHDFPRFDVVSGLDLIFIYV